jgi:hypothetical protein
LIHQCSDDPGGSTAPAKEKTMTDKSPRKTMSKKSGKSLKEKRADKHAKQARKADDSTVIVPARNRKSAH